MSVRTFLSMAAGVTLLFLGLGAVAVTFLSMAGFLLVPLASPLLLGAWLLLTGRPLARPFAVAVATIYGIAIGYVATTPWRGLTPPAGQARDPLDTGLVALALVFAVIALVAVVGSPAAGKKQRDATIGG
jgi:hypothetical protein